MWKKITKTQHRRGTQARTGCAVRRVKTDNQMFAVIPQALVPAGVTRADVFRSGARIGIKFDNRGEWKIAAPGGAKAKAVAVSLSKAAMTGFAIPYGTTDVPHSQEDDLLVLDLSQFAVAAAQAAE